MRVRFGLTIAALSLLSFTLWQTQQRPLAPVTLEPSISLVGWPSVSPGDRVEQPARSPNSESNLDWRDLGALYQGDLDRAITGFELSASQEPTRLHAWNDLAVARLTRAQLQDRSFDKVLALEAARRAVQLDPGFLPARFNLALALDECGLTLQAQEAWNVVLEREPKSPWLDVATSRSTHLRQKSRKLQFSEARRQVQDRLDTSPTAGHGDKVAALIEDLVDRFPYEARQWSEETLLADWASALTEGHSEQAQQILSWVRAIGRRLAHARNESMLQDTTAILDSALNGSTDADNRNELLAGHQLFGRGMVAYNARDIATAMPLLESARNHLLRGGSPFAAWAAFYHTVGIYYSDIESAFTKFERLGETLDFDRYPALAGRLAWMLGTIEAVRRRPLPALEQYRQALARMQSSSGTERAAFVHVLFAEAYDQVGDIEQSWRHRLQALRVVPSIGDPRRTHAMLNEAVRALLEQQRQDLALPFLDEMVTNGHGWAPLGHAEALRERARAQIALGNTLAAEADVSRARQAALEMPAGPIRQRVLASLTLTSGMAAVASDPVRAINELSTGFESQVTSGYEYERINHLSARAAAFEGLGDLPSARADYLAAIETYETLRSSLDDDMLRLRAFYRAQPAFDSLIRLALEQDDDEGAFAFSERARARFLLDTRDSLVPVEASQVSNLVPADVNLVSYAVLPRETVAWVFNSQGLRTVRLDTNRSSLGNRINEFRRALEQDLPEAEIRSHGTDLYDLLIRPLGLELAPEGILAIVPDRELQRLPFAALHDTETKQYLLEATPITIAPSATLALLTEPSDRLPASPGRLLILADPQPIASELNLPPLPTAQAEAEAIARLYPAYELLLGDQAAPQALLAGLSKADVLHIASHALANPEAPWESKLVLATDGSGDTQSPGTLSARDLLEHRLPPGSLVILSACQTLAGARDDREALLGLAGAFFGAGASAVVASRWDADDQVAGVLMPRFHRYLTSGLDPARALRHAALDLSEENEPARSPSAWAVFSVFGGAVAYPDRWPIPR